MSRRLTLQQQRILEERRAQQLENFDDSQLSLARVVAQHGAHLTIEDEEGTLHKAAFRQSLGAIVCGDYVFYTLEQDEPVVTTRLPRENVFSRLAYGGRERILAANLDQIFIVIAPKPEPSPSLFDRYLIATNYLKLPTAIIVNKYDLIEDETEFSFLNEYKAIDIPIYFTSIHHEASLDLLRERLNEKTSIFVGQSGVGKSSLTNILIPQLELQTQKINASTGLGNHTTSTTTLYHLPFGEESIIIDSPGVRSFNIEHLPISAINAGFPEVYPLTFNCRFTNCRHLQDPHCGVQKGVEEGVVSRRRVESYMQILSSLKSSATNR